MWTQLIFVFVLNSLQICVEHACLSPLEFILHFKSILCKPTGDLTDAKTKEHLGSRQHEVEWQTYQRILKKTRVMEKTKWLDIKGNHGKSAKSRIEYSFLQKYRFF
jgi:hypothetical protein